MILLHKSKTNQPEGCPFCGSDANLVESDASQSRVVGNSTKTKKDCLYGYGCSNPKCLIYTGYGVKLYSSKEDALNDWNTRYAKLIQV